jgi:hypothetical protein
VLLLQLELWDSAPHFDLPLVTGSRHEQVKEIHSGAACCIGTKCQTCKNKRNNKCFLFHEEYLLSGRKLQRIAPANNSPKPHEAKKMLQDTQLIMGPWQRQLVLQLLP